MGPRASVLSVRLLAGCPQDAVVRSDAGDVDSYLAGVPADRRAVLSEMRAVCGRLLAGFDESMRYGHPLRRSGCPAQVEGLAADQP
jgi:hypothetical protein